MARARRGRPRKTDQQVIAEDSSPSPQREAAVSRSQASPRVSPDVPVHTPSLPERPEQVAVNLTQDSSAQSQRPEQLDIQDFPGIQQLAEASAEQLRIDTTQAEVQSPGKKRRGRRGDGGPTKKLKDNSGTPAAPSVDAPQEDEYHQDGPFTETEKAVIDRFVTDFNNQYNLSQEAFNSLIQNKDRKLDELSRALWTSLYTVLPRRDHKAMQRHMRRRFHNFTKRGEWTPEEDEQLKALHEINPAKWKWIGEQIGRMAEDCRDRWRNYVVCGESRRTDHWSTREEQDLSIAVEECSREIKNAAKERAKQQQLAFREDQDWVSQINFNTVSERLGFQRSRLQCLQHWKALQIRELQGKSKRRVNVNKSNAKQSDPHKTAQLNYDSKMRIGDKYQILLDLRNLGIAAEADIRWTILAQKSPMRWSAADWKYAWLRMKELAERPADFPDIVVQIMNRFEKEHSEEALEVKYDPLHDLKQKSAPSSIEPGARPELAIDPTLKDDEAMISLAPSERPGRGKRGRRSKQFKSAERVGSSEPNSPKYQDAAPQAPQAPQAHMVEHVDERMRAGNSYEQQSHPIASPYPGRAPMAQMSQMRDEDFTSASAKVSGPSANQQPRVEDDTTEESVKREQLASIGDSEREVATLLAGRGLGAMNQNEAAD